MSNRLITPEQMAAEMAALINAAADELPEADRTAFYDAAVHQLQTVFGGFPEDAE